MPVTANKGLSVQAAGSGAGVWGAGASTALNEGVISLLDTMIGGQQTISLSSTNVTLTTSQSQYANTTFTGTLLANVTITTPGLGWFSFENLCTGSFAITIQFTGGVGSKVIIPQYTVRDYMIDSTNGVRGRNLDPPGTIKYLAVPTAALHPSLTGEYILPYGQAISRTTYANLFALFGTTYGSGDGSTTFNLPDARGRAIFGQDNMGGSAANRITVAGSGIDGTVFGATGGAQSTSLVTGNMPSHTHTASVTDPGHTHSLTLGQNGAASGGDFVAYKTGSGGTLIPGTSTTGISVTNTSVGSGTAFGTMNPAFLCNIMLKT